MENEKKEGNGGEKACCSKGKCCGGKALAAFALLVAGTIGGYLCGKQCPSQGGSKAASVQG